MAHDLGGRKLAFLATDMFEQVGLTEPWQAVEAARAQPGLVSVAARHDRRPVHAGAEAS